MTRTVQLLRHDAYNCPITSAWRVQLSNYGWNQACWWPIRFENFDIVVIMIETSPMSQSHAVPVQKFASHAEKDRRWSVLQRSSARSPSLQSKPYPSRSFVKLDPCPGGFCCYFKLDSSYQFFKDCWNLLGKWAGCTWKAIRSWSADWYTWNWITTLGTKTASSCNISWDTYNCLFNKSWQNTSRLN